MTITKFDKMMILVIIIKMNNIDLKRITKHNFFEVYALL